MTKRNNYSRGPQTRPTYRRDAGLYDNQVRPDAEAASERMEKMGGSPRIQLTAAKLSSGQKNLTYKPHQGKAERERRLAQMENNNVLAE